MKVMYVQLISGKLKLFHQMSIHLLKMNQLSPGRIQCEFTEGGTLKQLLMFSLKTAAIFNS